MVVGTWSRAISGMYDSVRWIRKASSSCGCCRSSEWQWLSTIGMRSSSRATSWRSVLEEVLVELERVVLLGVCGGLGTPDLQVLRREPGPERGHEDLVAVELVERLLRRRGEALDAALFEVLLGQVARVLVDALTGVDAVPDPIERRSENAAERDVRVRGVVAGLELEVRRAGLVVPVSARDSNGS